MTWLERLEGELEKRGVPRRRRGQIALDLEITCGAIRKRRHGSGTRSS